MGEVKHQAFYEKSIFQHKTAKSGEKNRQKAILRFFD